MGRGLVFFCGILTGALYRSLFNRFQTASLDSYKEPRNAI
jgi:hypothetical protein